MFIKFMLQLTACASPWTTEASTRERDGNSGH